MLGLFDQVYATHTTKPHAHVFISLSLVIVMYAGLQVGTKVFDV